MKATWQNILTICLSLLSFLVNAYVFMLLDLPFMIALCLVMSLVCVGILIDSYRREQRRKEAGRT